MDGPNEASLKYGMYEYYDPEASKGEATPRKRRRRRRRRVKKKKKKEEERRKEGGGGGGDDSPESTICRVYPISALVNQEHGLTCK